VPFEVSNFEFGTMENRGKIDIPGKWGGFGFWGNIFVKVENFIYLPPSPTNKRKNSQNLIQFLTIFY